MTQEERKVLVASPVGQPVAWLPIETAPKDGTNIFVWADGFEWPEVVRWELYHEDDAAEMGEVGYWTYSEETLANITDSPEPEQWTHWKHVETPGTETPLYPEATVKALVEALREAKLQLEYLDERFPTGTTPATLTRIDKALALVGGVSS